MPVGAEEFDLLEDPYHPHGGCLSFYESLIVASTNGFISAAYGSHKDKETGARTKPDPKEIAKFAIGVADAIIEEIRVDKLKKGNR